MGSLKAWITSCAVAVFLVTAAHPAHAALVDPEPEPNSILMRGYREEAGFVPGDGSPAGMPFVIDQVTSAEVRVIAKSSNLALRIQNPAGVWITEGVPGVMRFDKKTMPELPGWKPSSDGYLGLALMMGTIVPGATTYTVTMTSPPPGTYRIELSKPPGGADEPVRLIIDCHGGVLFGGQAEVHDAPGASKWVRLYGSVDANNAGEPLAGATVTGKVTPPGDGPTFEVSLKDDGTTNGGHATPGFYIAVVPLEQLSLPGTYVVLLEATGQTAAGHAFYREASCGFDYGGPGASFLPGVAPGKSPIALVLNPGIAGWIASRCDRAWTSRSKAATASSTRSTMIGT